jgi:hypothetical protein
MNLWGDRVLAEEVAELAAVPVAPGVVGHQPFDGDAVVGEEPDRSGEELGAGVGSFVGEDLGVREPAVVIDDGVDVVEPIVACRSRAGRTALAAVCSPAATVGDPADLLDVHVDQLAWPFTLVAHRRRLRGADQASGERVALA